MGKTQSITSRLDNISFYFRHEGKTCKEELESKNNTPRDMCHLRKSPKDVQYSILCDFFNGQHNCAVKLSLVYSMLLLGFPDYISSESFPLLCVTVLLHSHVFQHYLHCHKIKTTCSKTLFKKVNKTKQL